MLGVIGMVRVAIVLVAELFDLICIDAVCISSMNYTILTNH